MSTELDHVETRIGDQRLGVIHSGTHYQLGFGRNYYGIWESGSSGVPTQPTQKFPATEHGRAAAWQRYLELEPNAAQALAASRGEEEGETVKRNTTVRRLIILGLVVVVAVAAIIATQLNKGGGKGSSAGGPLGTSAHLDITGSQTVSTDLNQQTFKMSDFGGLFPAFNGQWNGSSVTLVIVDSIPKVGDDTTSQVPDKKVDITVTDSTGAMQEFKSVNGECTITLQTLVKDGVSGTLSCTGVQNLADRTKTIDVKGTFAAKS